jgi:hypothetical protein
LIRNNADDIVGGHFSFVVDRFLLRSIDPFVEELETFVPGGFLSEFEE